MQVYLSGAPVKLSDADLLGEGGEARVYRHAGTALKLFHQPSPTKLQKLAAFPRGLPSSVIAPGAAVHDAKGHVVGYQMRWVGGAHDFSRLASRKTRPSLNDVTALFTRLHEVVVALHGADVRVGDFNDGNVLFVDATPYLIDADSMQFGGFACEVGHERFLDPRLYGVDLTIAPRFTDGSDWYAFAVLLFQSLLSVHPFGGTHPKLATLLRRAEARHSVLRSDVLVPRLAASPKVLPDDLLHWFHATFEKDERQVFPPRLLQLPWTQCTCGTEHARAVCPECKTLGPTVTRQVLRSRGRCTARTAFETRGRVLAAAMQGGLRYLVEEDGLLRREDGTLIASSCVGSRRVAALAGAVTWLADEEGRVEKWQGDRLVERAKTETRNGWPVLAASLGGAWRQEEAWLIEQTAGTRAGQVLEGQTWLWAGERLGLGFYRAGGVTVPFILRAGKAGLKQLAGVTWSGRVIDAHAVFDARHALLSVICDDAGRDVVHRWLFDEDGALIAQSHGGVSGNAALLNGRVVLATDGGLVAMRADGGHLIEAMQFPDSQPFVSAGDELLPNSDGSLFIVGARDITQLSLS